MVKRKRQTVIYKTLHRNQVFEEHSIVR